MYIKFCAYAILAVISNQLGALSIPIGPNHKLEIPSQNSTIEWRYVCRRKPGVFSFFIRSPRRENGDKTIEVQFQSRKYSHKLRVHPWQLLSRTAVNFEREDLQINGHVINLPDDLDRHFDKEIEFFYESEVKRKDKNKDHSEVKKNRWRITRILKESKIPWQKQIEPVVELIERRSLISTDGIPTPFRSVVEEDRYYISFRLNAVLQTEYFHPLKNDQQTCVMLPTKGNNHHGKSDPSTSKN